MAVVLDELPELTQCHPSTLSAGDVLLVAGGFEDRAFASADIFLGAAGARAIALDYLPFDARNRTAELCQKLSARGFSAVVVQYDRYHPEPLAESLAYALLLGTARRIVIDISGMSKLAIMIAMDVACDLDLEVTIFYAEAEQYGPSKNDYDTARSQGSLHQPTVQLYTGVQGVMRTSRLSSVAMQGQPSAAIAFMSFNEYVTQALVDAVYPSRLFLINGRPPALTWREAAMYWIHEQLITEWPSEDNPVTGIGDERIPLRATSTLHYGDTVRELLGLYWQIAADYRILLAPTGSKMQTVASYLVKALHPDIHVEYPTPKGFLDLYSTGIAQKWQVSFPALGRWTRGIRLAERRSRFANAAPHISESQA